MTTINRLAALRTATSAIHPPVGAWLVSATKREAMAITALMERVETWHDTVRARWLAAVVADTYEWSIPDAWDIAHKEPDSEYGWHADSTPLKWWEQLRYVEEGRQRDVENLA